MHLFSKIKLLILFLLLSASLISQEYNRELNPFPVSGLTGNYNNSFSGGTNNLEFQFIDIDDDGDSDLFYLDSDENYGWYENTGTSTSPEFQLSFDTIPNMVFSDWFYMIDIDNDEDFDIFTGNNIYVRLIKNIGTKSSPLFQSFTDTVKNSDGNPVISESGSNPVFVDIDDDNDFDLVSGNTSGTLTYYENIGTASNYNFKFVTNQWQDIIIIGGDFLHGASSLEFADIDDDNDLDLFWGDFFSKSLYYIENSGTASIPDLNVLYNSYPQNEDSIWTSGFNMPRLFDIDSDNDLDLFVSVLYDPTVPQSLVFVENKGTAQNPDFDKITDDYLYTLDVGNNSYAVFEDIDNDNDEDMFIGSLKNPLGSLYYFENTGGSSSPKFDLITESFFGIESDLSVVPAFGDIDGDNDLDLFIGNFNGTISFYENTGTQSSPQFNSSLPLQDKNGMTIDAGTSVSPFLIDYDSDNDLDLITGSFNGRFALYKNTGTNLDYEFEKDTSYFSIIDVGDNSTPVLFDFDDDDDLDLFSGNRLGYIYIWRNDGNNLSPIWNLQTDKFLNQDFGGQSMVSFIDINNDSDTDLVFGNVKGGLYFYNNLTVSGISGEVIPPEEFEILQAYPNPFNPATKIIFRSKRSTKLVLSVYNILGKKVRELYSDDVNIGTNEFLWNGKDENGKQLPSGVYLIYAETPSRNTTIKVNLIK